MRILFISLCMLLPACSPSAIKSADCANFPVLGNQTISKIYDLPDADQTLPSIISAKQAIGRCYPKMSHEMAIYELNQKDVKADETDNSYILTYWLAGVSDVAIAFRVDRSGHVIEAFEYSTM
ncbi:hypothetical protein [Sphingopyxis sp.]|uniref:hypothetical protein n=1 Tax=Sphingopyxis sp. TaxID=1908224 RepID=UPI003D108FD7